MALRRLLLVFLLPMLLLTGTALAQDETETIDLTIAELIVIIAELDDDPDFTVLRDLLESIDALETLADEEASFMLFAPTDAAFEYLAELLESDLETIFADDDLTEMILLFHVSEELYTLEELQEQDTVSTLQGADIEVVYNASDDEFILNGSLIVLEGDIVVDNGIIHVIDEVMLPPVDDDTLADEQETEASNGGKTSSTTASDDSDTDTDTDTDTEASEPCFVRTDEVNSVRVRVGPGTNRTAVTFLPADLDLPVQGRTEVDGEVWYQLNVEDAAPGRAINEAWVSVENLTSTGDCENIADADAPPLVPIINQPPPQTGEEEADTGDGSAPADTTGLIRPAAGDWLMTLAGTVNASCEGTGNVQIPTSEVFPETSFTESLSPSGDSFVLTGTPFAFIGDNTHQGERSDDSLTGTLYVTFSSPTQASGRFITSFNADGIGCSATVGFTMSR